MGMLLAKLEIECSTSRHYHGAALVNLAKVAEMGNMNILWMSLNSRLTFKILPNSNLSISPPPNHFPSSVFTQPS